VRVLRPGGRVVLSHTDFAGLVVHGAKPGLTARIVHAYAHLPQQWMAHIDPLAARRLLGLAAGANLIVERIDGHVYASQDRDGCERLGESVVDRVTQLLSPVSDRRSTSRLACRCRMARPAWWPMLSGRCVRWCPR
jgi:hypothetical protein